MYAFLVVLSLLMKEALLLKITQMTVPASRVIGEEAELVCRYKLEDDRLYSVKWYRDGVEFYRYTPDTVPQRNVFVVDGIDVNLRKSNDWKVTLRQVTLEAAGLYRCEVSGDAPHFHSATGEGRMEIFNLPSEPPRITGEQLENTPGDTIQLNCTSGKSYPPATLGWEIDGENITDSDLLIEYPPILYSEGSVSILGLQVPYYGNTMRFRCTAKVASAWEESSETIIKKYRPVRIVTSHLAKSAAETSTITATLLILLFAILGA